jgi:hypothetical protein
LALARSNHIFKITFYGSGSSLAAWGIYASWRPFPKLDARGIGYRRVRDFPGVANVVIGFT